MADVRNRNRSANKPTEQKKNTKNNGLFKILQVQIIICCLIYLSFLGLKMIAGENYKTIKAGTFETTYKLTNLYDLNFKLDELAKKNKVIAFLLGRRYFYNTPIPIESNTQEDTSSQTDENLSSKDETSEENKTPVTQTSSTVSAEHPLSAGITTLKMSASDMDALSVNEEPLQTEGGVSVPDTVDEKLYFSSKVYQPVPSGYITSPFGIRSDPFTKKSSFHTGVDLRAPEGTKVSSFAKGKVSKIGETSVWGNYVIIEHADGFSSFYAHLSKVSVKEGASVKGGKTIGLSGNTGRSTGAHLHFEIRINGKYTDPALYLDIA